MAPQASTPPESGGAAFSFPVREAQRALSEKGAYVVEDAAAGRRVDDFINAKQLPLRKVDGLAFCAQNSFYDKVCCAMSGRAFVLQLLTVAFFSFPSFFSPEHESCNRVKPPRTALGTGKAV